MKSSVELKPGVKFILKDILCEITEVQVKLIRYGVVKTNISIEAESGGTVFYTAEEILEEWRNGKLKFIE